MTRSRRSHLAVRKTGEQKRIEHVLCTYKLCFTVHGCLFRCRRCVAAKSELPEVERQQQFSFMVSQVLDMTVQDQQLLLQTKNTGFRLRKQRELLETARQYLAAQATIKDALGR